MRQLSLIIFFNALNGFSRFENLIEAVRRYLHIVHIFEKRGF